MMFFKEKLRNENKPPRSAREVPEAEPDYLIKITEEIFNLLFHNKFNMAT